MADMTWVVVGGGDKGGILVRDGKDLTSNEAPERLSTGALVRGIELIGERLRYKRLEGAGPDEGWVSIRLKGKELLRPDGRFDEIPATPVFYAKATTTKASTPPLVGSYQLPFGKGLPPIMRNFRCPGGMAVPENMRGRSTFEGLKKKRVPKLYILAFPGASDQVLNGWLQLEIDAPEHVELATHEWPGHGSRSNEEHCELLEDIGGDAFDAFAEPMSQGNFIVVGHSIGCMIMTYVCERAERELGVRPRLAFALDRGPPHLDPFTKWGKDLMFSSPEAWCKLMLPHIYAQKDRKGSDAYSHVPDYRLEVDVRPVGWYVFPCCLHVLVATWPPVPPEAPREFVEDLGKLTKTGAHCLFHYPEDFQQWQDWCDEVYVYKLEDGHEAIKMAPTFHKLLWTEVDKLLQSAKSK